MMTHLNAENLKDLRRAFDLTQDSGVIDQYGAKKMLQIFNMNPTTEDVTSRYAKHNKEPTAGLTFEEFEEMFRDYLENHTEVPSTLSNTIHDLFDGPVSRAELRKILTEMGSEPMEADECDEVMNEIDFDDTGLIAQEDLCEFLLNRVNMNRPPSEPAARKQNIDNNYDQNQTDRVDKH